MGQFWEKATPTLIKVKMDTCEISGCYSKAEYEDEMCNLYCADCMLKSLDEDKEQEDFECWSEDG